MLPQALLVVVLAPLALACKCFTTNEPVGQFKGVTTIECCNKYHGRIHDRGGDVDCAAHSIKDHLNDFWKCCNHYNGLSDCYHIEDAAELFGLQRGEEEPEEPEEKDAEA